MATKASNPMPPSPASPSIKSPKSPKPDRSSFIDPNAASLPPSVSSTASDSSSSAPKWLPLQREYSIEASSLSSKLSFSSSPLHPLLSRDQLARMAKENRAAADYYRLLMGKTATATTAGLLSVNASAAGSVAGSKTNSPRGGGAKEKEKEEQKKKQVAEEDDPLTAMKKQTKKQEVFDPLRAFAAASSASSSSSSSSTSQSISGSSSSSASSSAPLSTSTHPFIDPLAASGPVSISRLEPISFDSLHLDADSLSSPTSPLPSSSSSSPSSSFFSPSSSLHSSRSPPYIPWREHRVPILSRYTTNSKIPVSAHFIEEEVSEKAVNKPVDRTSIRIEELESETGSSKAAKEFLTQREYISHIEEQHDRLKQAWAAGERVTSLKIAISCAKLLADTSVPQFYPSMYVLLTDILDTFGDLVFERIKKKGKEEGGGSSNGTKAGSGMSLPPNFESSDVSASAQETCRNWFYKTACIRELLPRLYIDMSLLKCYRFIEPSSRFPLHFQRLSRQMRGIGDPLVSIYARSYLAMKCGDVGQSFHHQQAKAGEATHIDPLYQPPLIESFDDFFFCFQSLNKEQFSMVSAIKNKLVSYDQYLDLFAPALQFLLQSIGYNNTEDLFFGLLQQYKDYCNLSLVLKFLLSSFPSEYISSHVFDIITIIKASETISSVPKSQLYLEVGKCLIRVPPPSSQRLQILNDIWKVVTKLEDLNEYMEIACVFIQYLLQNFSDREVNIFLKDVITHCKGAIGGGKDKEKEKEKEDSSSSPLSSYQSQLSHMVKCIMAYSKDLYRTLSMDHFLPLLDLLDKSHKISAAKSVLIAFSLHGFSTADPIIINTLFDVSRSLHNSIDSLSFIDERRQISLLIINFIRQLDYGRDLEAQLNTYVQCRQAFTSLDLVTIELVQQVSNLCMKAYSYMNNGRHSKKTAAFVKAALAYCHITIPSLDDIFSRLKLFLLCGQIALINGMIVQGEGFLKAAISLLPDVPSTIEQPISKRIISTEEDLVAYLRSFASLLLVFPGHPEHGPFYLVKGLLNAVQTYGPWAQQTEGGILSPSSSTSSTSSTGGSVSSSFLPGSGKLRVYLGVFQLFLAYSQRNFLYHISGVESNDSMYGGESSYTQQLHLFLETLINEIVRETTRWYEQAEQQQSTVGVRSGCVRMCLDVVNVLIDGVQMNATSATVVVKLYQVAAKQCDTLSTMAVERRYLKSTLAHIGNKKTSWYEDILAKIQVLQHTEER